MNLESVAELDLSSASDEQEAIILAIEPKVLVQASAGSGKTWTVAQRYLKHVLCDEVDPSEILCVTFTNRAAVEMRDRVISAFEKIKRTDLAQKAEHAVIGTIHSLCTQILKENAVAAQMDPDFEILGEEEYKHRLRGSIHQAILSNANVPEVHTFLNGFIGKTNFISRGPYEMAIELVINILEFLRALPPSRINLEATDDGSTLQGVYSSPKQLEAYGLQWAKDLAIPQLDRGGLFEGNTLAMTCGCYRLAIDAWRLFETQLLQDALVDYAFLERSAIKLLTKNPEVNRRVSGKYRVLIVDEAQDLNPLQQELLRSIHVERTLFVGDDKQSIYRFRQAAPHLFRALASEFKVLPLSKNRRSLPAVLEGVDGVFSPIWSHYPAFMDGEDPFALNEDFETDSIDRGSTCLFRTSKDFDSGSNSLNERSTIVRWIQDRIASGMSPKSMAVLVQSWGYGSNLQADLLREGVESKLLEGAGLLPRMETRDLANALTCVMTQSDQFALLAVLRGPLVELSLDGVVQVSELKDPYRDLQTCQFSAQGDQEKVQEFLTWWKPLAAIAFRLNAFEVIDRLIRDGGFLAKLARGPRREEAIANIRKLLAMAAMRPEADSMDFAEFLRTREKLRVGIKDADIAEEESECITITTIHQAKGLEWDHVIIAQTKRREADFFPMLAIDNENPFFLIGVPSAAGKVFSKLKEREKQQLNEEAQRKLYVGMTRAKTSLDIYLPTAVKKDTISIWVKPLALMGSPHEI